MPRTTSLLLVLLVAAIAALGSSPAAANPLSSVASIAVGNQHSCALTSGGGVKCWGDNFSGQLGDGTTTDRHTPVGVAGLSSGIVALSGGSNYTCALTTAGGVQCWGVGIGLVPADVAGLSSGVARIAAGGAHMCALMMAGGVKCWGDNAHGQLGDGTTEDRSAPVDVTGLSSGVAAIAAGFGHTCALMTSGGAKCWGDNLSGQLGDGTTADRYAPVDVSGLASGVTAIAAGGAHTCALTVAGGVKCWGHNTYGQLGNGTTSDRHAPADVSGLTSGVTAIAGGAAHTCALTTGGGVQCWGQNFYGELGDGTTCCGDPPHRATPADVSALSSGVSAIAAGADSHHTCALTSSGSVQCWGSNQYGQLGDATRCCGEVQSRLSPVDVVVLGKIAIGNVDCNGFINSIDAALILQLNARLVSKLPCQGAADVNLDGRTNSLDAFLLLQYDAGLIHTLPP